MTTATEILIAAEQQTKSAVNALPGGLPYSDAMRQYATGLGTYASTPSRKRTTIYIEDADNGKVIMIGDTVCRLVPEGANLADELAIALVQAKLS